MAARFLGEFLIERGVIDTVTLLKGLQFQSDRSLQMGDAAVKMGMLDATASERIKAEQLRSACTFEEAARRLDLLNESQLGILTTKQQQHRVLLGEALVAIGALDAGTLEAELQVYQREQEASRAAILRAKVDLGWANEQPVPAVVDELVRVLYRSANLAAKEGFAEMLEQPPGDGIRVAVRLAGDWTGDVVVRTDHELGAEIARRVLVDWPGSVPSELVPEAIKEIVATGVRSASIRLGRIGGDYRQTQAPRLVQGDDLPEASGPILRVPLTTPFGLIDLVFIRVETVATFIAF